MIVWVRDEKQECEGEEQEHGCPALSSDASISIDARIHLPLPPSRIGKRKDRRRDYPLTTLNHILPRPSRPVQGKLATRLLSQKRPLLHRPAMHRLVEDMLFTMLVGADMPGRRELGE